MIGRRSHLLLVLGIILWMMPLVAAPAAATTGHLVITGVVDGPLSGGVPKAIELYVVDDIADLSVYGVGSANNGNGSNGEEFTFPAVTATAGDFLYVASETAGFNAFFGFDPDYTTNAASVNGDDAVELFENGAVVDVFGEIDTDGTGRPWEYTDGWAYRVDESGADGSTFVLSNWTFSGPNALDGETTNGTAAAPFPIGAYTGSGTGTPPTTSTAIINEVDADQPGTDSAEFVEIFDGGTGGTSLDGLVIVLYNGSNDTSYGAFDLDGLTTGTDGYFVLCGDAATVANCDLDATPDTDLIQNGADAVALYEADAADFPDGTAVTTDGLVDAIVYDTSDGDDEGLLVLLNPGQPQVDERGGGNGTGHSNQRCPNGSGGARNTDTYAQFAPTPGEENVCVDAVEVTSIHEIQGPGSETPMPGARVTIEGVVVGDYEGHDGLNGFYVEEEIADWDADPETSEGIFVYNPRQDSVSLGDIVQVAGTVAEYQDQTQIGYATITVVGAMDPGAPAPLVDAVRASLPVPDAGYLERYEGMLVGFDQTLFVTEMYQLGRFGQITVSAGDRLPQPTAVAGPGAPAAAVQAANDLNRLIVDDQRNTQNPDPILFGGSGDPLTASNPLRGGDTLDGLVGVMTYGWSGNRASGNAYRLRPVADLSDTGLVPGGVVPDFEPANPRPPDPPSVGGSIDVASLNVLNYFLTLDGNGKACGPDGFPDYCRGADTAVELERQRAKLLSALETIDADIVGLIELENTEGVEPLADIVAGLNADLGTSTYAYVDTGTIGSDVIKVGIIYKPATVTLEGPHQILDASVDPRFDDDLNRPALAQTFTEHATGAEFTVVVNHLKSKGCRDAEGANLDQGDGQGCYNPARTDAAAAEVEWIESGTFGGGDPKVLILGDLNAYAMEDPVGVFTDAGYTDLVAGFGPARPYSYVYDGQWGYLDYAVASPGMADRVTGAAEFPINADEASVLDYNTDHKSAEQIVSLYAPDEFRSSDHDPVVVGLDLVDVRADKQGVVDELVALLPAADRRTERRLSRAIRWIERSLNPGWWTSDRTISNRKVFDRERKAVVQLVRIAAAGGPEAGVAGDAVDTLVEADRQLAQIELAAAVDRDGNARRIAVARRAMARAAARADAGRYAAAINAYKAAWRAASRA